MPVTDVIIHHNPDCGTSRNVVRIVEAAGYRPVIVEYLKTGWNKPQLLALLADAGLSPRDALRLKKSPAEELGLTDPSVADEDILPCLGDLRRHLVDTGRTVDEASTIDERLDFAAVGVPRGGVDRCASVA